MSAIESLRASSGSWTGTSSLWLPEEPTREGDSTASVSPAIRGNFSSITYTWAFDGQPQEGQLLLGHDATQNAVSAVFLDSWHMGDKFMRCQGQLTAQGAVDVRGSYAVEGGPDWGWRIVVESAEATLRVTMYNVAPEGEEYLGFVLAYSRAA